MYRRIKKVLKGIILYPIAICTISMAIIQAGQIIVLPDGSQKVSVQKWETNAQQFYDGCKRINSKGKETEIIYLGMTVDKDEAIKKATKEIENFNLQVELDEKEMTKIDAYYVITKNKNPAILLVRRGVNIVVDQKPTINDGTVYEKLNLRN